MQHYGVATRLLDWTEILGVALYFAIHQWRGSPGEPIPREYARKDPPCIWILNPYELNELHWGTRDVIDPKNLGWDSREQDYYTYGELLLEESALDWNEPVAVYPRQRTDRMQAQRGWFTMHGDVYQALDQTKTWKQCGRKVVLPAEALDDAYRFLRDAGIGIFTLFPDLPNLAVYLERQRMNAFEDFLRKTMSSSRHKTARLDASLKRGKGGCRN